MFGQACFIQRDVVLKNAIECWYDLAHPDHQWLTDVHDGGPVNVKAFVSKCESVSRHKGVLLPPSIAELAIRWRYNNTRIDRRQRLDNGGGE